MIDIKDLKVGDKLISKKYKYTDRDEISEVKNICITSNIKYFDIESSSGVLERLSEEILYLLFCLHKEPKFKAGDRVKVKKDADRIYSRCFDFSRDMKRYLGDVFTINSVFKELGNYYTLNEDDSSYYLDENWLELPESNISFDATKPVQTKGRRKSRIICTDIKNKEIK